jgi:uncharacterized membrane protein YdjX (TVP38/TMEM64 family)
MSPPVFSSTRARVRALAALAAVALLLLLGAGLVGRYAPALLDVEALRATVAAYGPLAPAAFVGLQAAQILLAPVPGQVLGFVGGYLFGTVAGTAYSLLGATIGSTVAFVLSRRYGRPFVADVLAAETLAAFDGFVDRHGVFAVFLVFLLPGLPDDAICFMAGVTRIPIRHLVAVSVVGRLPGYFLVSLAGARLATAQPLATAGILLALAVASTAVYWQRDALLARLGAGS